MITNRPVLPDWTRWSWASVTEREWWAPLFSAASNAYQELERLSVVEGLRPAAFVNVAPDKLIENVEWARNHNILCVPVSMTGISSSYSSTQLPVTNNLYAYRVLFVQPEWYSRTNNLADNNLGELLGYPACCRAAFDATWGQKQVDSTWEQTKAGTASQGPAESSTLMRWMGLRFVSHMPCTMNCQASVDIGKRMFDLGVRHGYKEEMHTIREVLNWPMEWSRLFGIAEIVTPALKISTRSDWTPTKDAFTRTGTYIKPSKTWWTNNGFSSASGMRDSHKLIIDAIIDTIPHNARVLDLGCGNGQLLRRLKFHRPDIRIAGIDIQQSAIAEANSVIDLTSKFWHGKIEDGQWKEWNPTVVLYTPGRLLEMDSNSSTQLREWLSTIPLHVVYSYADWNASSSLDILCSNANLLPSRMLVKTPMVQVGVISQL